MDEIIILNRETYSFLMLTLRQCNYWLETDAVYSHSKSTIRIVKTNVENSLKMINDDIEKYKDNCKILIEELNKQKTDV